MLALGLAGCGDDDKDSSDEPEPNGVEELKPAAAIKESVSASRNLSDVTYAGNIGFDFETGVKRVRARITVTRSGNCEAVMQSKAAGKTTIRLVGRTSYLRGDVKAWTGGFGAPEENARILSGKWISSPVDAEAAADCSIKELSAAAADKGSCTKGKEGEVDGTATIALKCTDDGDPGTMHIATVGEPLVLRFVGSDDGGPFDYRLVDHDTGVTIKAPPKKDVIDGTQFG